MSNQNESAFPTPAVQDRNGDVIFGECGLTKLEYFSIRIFQAYLDKYRIGECSAGTMASYAVHDAKALITELENAQ